MGSRSRASAKSAGTAFETSVAGYLSGVTEFPIRRMPKSGSKDLGDILGVSVGGKSVAVECKNPGKDSPWKIAQWHAETRSEIDNLGASMGVLMVKRYRAGVEDSVCVFDKDSWDVICDQIADSDLNEHPSIPFSKWTEVLDEEGIFKTRRRGEEGFWYVAPLSLIEHVFDSLSKAERIILTEGEVADLLSGAKIGVKNSRGENVMVVMNKE